MFEGNYNRCKVIDTHTLFSQQQNTRRDMIGFDRSGSNFGRLYKTNQCFVLMNSLHLNTRYFRVDRRNLINFLYYFDYVIYLVHSVFTFFIDIC